MGFLARLERRSLENPRTSLSAAIEAWDSGAKTHSGASISEANALNLSAVWAAVRLLANTMASMPIVVYERLEPRGKTRSPTHPVYRLLHDRPNPEMSAWTWKGVLQGHIETWGNAYAEKERNGRGEVVAYWPITPNRVTPRWAEVRGGIRKVFEVNVDGAVRVFGTDQILHIPGFGFDGLQGYSPIRMARESLGLAKAAEEFGSRMFGQGLRTSGVLTHPRQLGDKARDNLKKSIAAQNEGLSNAHRIMLLEEGLTWTQTSLPPEDAQFLETRVFQTVEVARWFGVPPHKLADMSRATFSNIEHQSIEFVTDTVRPRCVGWEQVLNHEAFSQADRGKYFAEYNIEALLRGDTAARASFYSQMVNIGVYSQNDVREKENENPVDGGDRYWVQGALVPIDKIDDVIDAKKKPEPAPAPAPDDEPEEQDEGGDGFERFRPVLLDAAERVLRREVEQLRAAIKRGNVETWADGFYYQEHAGFAAGRFLPACLAIDMRNGAKLAGKLGSDWATVSLAEVRRVVKDGGDLEVLAKWWENERADEFVRSVIDDHERRMAA